MNTYFKYTGLNLDGLREQLRPQAERQVKGRLILEKVAALENITPSEDEINEEFNKMATAYSVPLEQVKQSIDAAVIAEDLKVRKALDLIKKKANITVK